ncbi:hypothetical protein N7494_009401 [Penicillium frequentans]|uniref:Uncharacterized protein n=1 Tax=Penicillium frequentans TaxID=3151616 RepID=A0AAD6GDD2_9EURO|nr:hypothetical protein N7494_009401 [Penicillium glabrum]
MPTWFLPPDFTFTPEGPLRLGTIITHPARPTLVLASLPGDTGIILPKETTLVEPNHSHEKSISRSHSLNIWANFLEVTSATVKIDTGRQNVESYGTVDHEIRFFADPLTPSVASAITALPDVKKHINSGVFGRRPVYIVTGLRIARTSFTVSKDVSKTLGGEISGSGTIPGGIVPITAGAGISGSSERKTTGSYDTAPGIVFAYRLSVIRTKRAGVETELFDDKAAFLTGDETDVEQPLVVVEATREELEEDFEEQSEFQTLELERDETCLWF